MSNLDSLDTIWTLQARDKISGVLDEIDQRFSRIEASMGNVRTRSGSPVKRRGGLFGSLRDEATSTFGSIGGGLGQFQGLLGGLPPQAALAGAAVGAVVGTMATSTQKAAEFSDSIVPIQNLAEDMGRTSEEIATLGDEILDVSWDAGRGTDVITKAMYDTMSVTGQYGDAVEDFTERISGFSKGVKAEFNTAVEASASAMKIYGMELSEVDRVLASASKTVKVGKTTYSELFENSGEFLSGAKAAGQDMESAFQIFAALTIPNKNSDIAATMSKGFFEALGDSRTIESFADQDVSIFNEDESMRQVDQILADLGPKLQQMSDVDFSKFMEDIGGNEGMAQVLSMARSNLDGLLGTFQSFDDTNINIDNKIAQGDESAKELWNTFNSKLNVAMIKLGEAILPTVTDVLDFINQMMDAWAGKTEGVGSAAQTVADVLEFLWDAWMFTWDAMSWPMRLIIDNIDLIIEKLEQAWDWVIDMAEMVVDPFGWLGINEDEEAGIDGGQLAQNAKDLFVREVIELKDTEAFQQGDVAGVFSMLDQQLGESEYNDQALAATGQTITDLLVNAAGGMDNVLGKINSIMLAQKAQDAKTGSTGGITGGLPELKPADPGSFAGGGKKKRGGTELISAGKGIKNITVNIQTINGINTLQVTEINDSYDDLEEQIKAVLVKSIRDVERVTGES